MKDPEMLVLQNTSHQIIYTLDPTGQWMDSFAEYRWPEYEETR